MAQPEEHCPHHISGRLNVIGDRLSHHNGMASSQGDLRPDLPEVAHTPDRPVCHQVQQETTPVHVPRQGRFNRSMHRDLPI